MNNLPSSASRPFLNEVVLPVELSLALTPWFSNAILQKGFKLLRQEAIQYYMSFRYGAGVVFDSGLSADLIFVKSDKTSQGFVLHTCFCQKCNPDKRGLFRCSHVAAAAILSLQYPLADQISALPLVFESTPWSKLGRHLYSLSDGGGCSHQVEKANNETSLKVTGKNGFSLQLRISAKAADELSLTHPAALCNSSEDKTSSSIAQGIIRLRDKLIKITRTDMEIALVMQDRKSRKGREDSSFWLRLSSYLAIHCDFKNLRVDRGPDKLFRLILPGPKDEKPLLSITLPRLNSLELLLNFPASGFAGQRLPAATPYSKVYPDGPSGGLVVENMIRLSDDRCFLIQDIIEDQYGSYYYLENEGFLPLQNPPSDEVIRGPKQKKNSLFQFSAMAQKTATGFTVPGDKVRDFLAFNSQALKANRHEVNTCFINSEIIKVPDRLELTSFEEKNDWCYLGGFYGIGNRQLDLTAILEQGAAKKDYMVGEKWLSLQDTPLAWFHRLGIDRICRNEKDQACIRLRPHEMLTLTGQMPELKVDGRRKDTAAQLDSLLKGVTGDERRSKIAPHLRDYQQHGTAWLDYLSQHHLGGILADDMGLGKTHQALAFIDLQAGDKDGARFLIACPASVMLNWLNKAQQFFPDLNLALYYGQGRDLDSALESDIIVTTYGVMRNDIEELSQIPFKTVLFDEMQQLKNSSTLQYKAALQLSCDTMVGLTGTPIENSLLELQALFDLCLPDLFDNRDFRNTFIKHDSPESREQLSRIIRPFMLRRTRKQVLGELPDIIDDVRSCELHEDQVGLYREIIEENQALKDGLLEKEQVNTVNVLAMITRLKQVCNHPALLEGANEWELYGSGKWELWKELIKESLASGFKVVVFSQFTGMLDIMTNYLTSIKVSYCEIRGKMNPTSRQKSIDTFAEEDGPKICLASLLAAGTGIDLTAAQVVIHYDRWWNPAKEEQATARVHRMGQRRVVQVIKLYNKGTLEEKMHQLIEKKKSLARDVISEDDASIMKQLKREDLIELLSFSD
ncbi:MAG: DEAD/DEAH box helicase [Desulfobulbaceae bacterium]|nr:DEAD/DEAH box helicase [Desulfobulbaceae bacterium]